MKFDYALDFKRTDFRARPELYRVGRGEQGVLLVEPYKSELLRGLSEEPHLYSRWLKLAVEGDRRSLFKLKEDGR